MRTFALSALLATASALVTVHGPSVVPNGWSVSEESLSGSAVFHSVMIGLKRSNTDRLSQLAKDVSDPNGPRYLQYPTFEEMGDLVRPAAEHTAAVKAWVAEHGATIVKEHPHGDYLTLDATAAQLEAMAGGAFVAYTHGATGMTVHRITTGVRVPQAVAAAIDTFSGFHGFPLEPKKATKLDAVPNGCAVNPPKVRSTYNVSHVAKSGKKNIQAIAQFQGQYVSSTALARFCEKFDPESKTCTIEKFVGKNHQFPCGVESMLDTEYITSLSQDAETWVYSYPSSDFCNDLLSFGTDVMGEAVHPFVISVSYGSQKIDFCAKNLMTRFASDVEKFGAMGVTTLISSGDDGSGHSTRGGINAGKLSPAYPASVPHAIAVGATYFASGISGEEEASTQFGSGGGFSYDFAAPSYQTAAIGKYLSTVSLPKTYAYAKGGRGTPDVSALGQAFAVEIEFGIVECVGGTSASSPSTAALITLLNEVSLAATGKSLGFLNPLFYQNPQAFTDITKGTNAIGANTEGWAAIKGWDASTGLGTPNFPALVAVVKKALRNVPRN